MSCTEGRGFVAMTLPMRLGLAGLGLLAGCNSPAPPSPASAASTGSTASSTRAPAATEMPAAPPATTRASAAAIPLPPPGPVHNWAEVRHQAALRLVAANPAGTYMGIVPDQLLAIPVLEIELNGDGSVRKISYLRQPREAKDTLLLAAAAVRRAAPFGDVSHLPKPWRFTETFLFNDDRKFKPRTLD